MQLSGSCQTAAPPTQLHVKRYQYGVRLSALACLPSTQACSCSRPFSRHPRPLQSVLVHQLSKHTSQNPFRKNRGRVMRVAFHPSKPFFFVATQNAVRIYNLAKQVCVAAYQVHCSSQPLVPAAVVGALR